MNNLFDIIGQKVMKMDFDEGLVSCDTFVVMGGVTNTGEVVFGKNS